MRIIKKMGKIIIMAFYKVIYYCFRPFLHSKSNLTAEQACLHLQNTSPCPSGTIHANNLLDPQFELMIIIPAYNVEKYIDACLDSVLMQETSFNYKAVVIDDGSTDGTADRLKKYQGNARIEVIHQENRGLSGARNTALEHIIGKYIMFLDSDDKLPQFSIESLMKKAIQTNADIVEGNRIMFTTNGTVTTDILHKDSKNLASPLKLKLRGFAWGKVFRAELFQYIKFPEGYWFEDTIMTMLIYPLNNNSHTIKEIVYEYFINPQGISSTCRSNLRCIESFWITDYLLKEQLNCHVELTPLTYMCFLQQVIINNARTNIRNKQTQESIFVLTKQWYERLYMDKNFTVSGNFKALEATLQENNFNAYKLLLKGFRFK